MASLSKTKIIPSPILTFRQRGKLLLLLLAAIFVPRPALANGRLPATNGIYFQPNTPLPPGIIFVRATFGMLISNDGGKTFHWLCEDAFGGLPPAYDPNVAITASGNIVLTTPAGVFLSTDQGCDWSMPTALNNLPTNDVAVAPPDYKTVYVLAGSSTSTGQLYISHDEGQTFTPTNFNKPAVVLLTIRISPSNPNRIYI